MPRRNGAARLRPVAPEELSGLLGRPASEATRTRPVLLPAATSAHRGRVRRSWRAFVMPDVEPPDEPDCA